MIVQFYCERCARYVAEGDVVTLGAPKEASPLLGTGAEGDHGVRLPGCPTCRGLVRREEQEIRRPLERVALRDAFFPMFAPRNLPLLLATTFFAFFVWRFVPVVGFVMSSAILLAYAAQASRTAADPREAGSLGEPADFRGWSDLLGPLGRRLFVLAVGLTPLVVTLSVTDDVVVRAAGTLAGAVFYVLYTPAALIVAARARSLTTLVLPLATVRVALGMGADYALAAGLHLASTIGGTFLVGAAFWLAGLADRYVAIFPFFVAWAVLVLVTTFQARLLGIFAREHRHVLGLETG